MARIIPIRDLRNTTEVERLCHASHDPVYVTKNGYGNLVVMSIQAYQNRMMRADLISKVREAEADPRPLLDGEEVLTKLRGKYVN